MKRDAMKNLTLRLATASDLPQLTQLAAKLQHGWHGTRLQGFLVNSLHDGETLGWIQKGFVTVAHDGDRLAGYTIAYPIDSDDGLKIKPYFPLVTETQITFDHSFVFLHQIAVDPSVAGKGVGRALYETLFAKFPGVPVLCFIVEKPDPNVTSRLAHEKIGFRRVGTCRLKQFLKFTDYQSGVFYYDPS